MQTAKKEAIQRAQIATRSKFKVYWKTKSKQICTRQVLMVCIRCKIWIHHPIDFTLAFRLH